MIKHIHIKEYPYFVTTTTGKVDLFSNSKFADNLLSCIYYGRRNGWYLLLSFVIMPDHLHIIVVPLKKNISEIMKSIKGYSARFINSGIQSKGSIWQKGFYDYVLDTEEKLLTKINYIEYNPVKKDLVLESTMYPYSSANKQNLTDLNKYLSN